MGSEMCIRDRGDAVVTVGGDGGVGEEVVGVGRLVVEETGDAVVTVGGGTDDVTVVTVVDAVAALTVVTVVGGGEVTAMRYLVNSPCDA